MGTTSRSICTVRSTLTLLLCISLTCSIHCEARGKTRASRGPRHSRSHHFKRMAATGEGELMESSNTGPYGVGSPFTLPPFESLPPVTLPDTSPSPPYCVNPPSTPQTPPGTLPSPTVNPPFYYVPPIFPVPSTPGSTAPSLPPPYFEPILSPPPFYFPSPPSGGGGGGGGGGLSPPIFLPPVIFPAPRAPPPPKTGGPSMALWCVAKPSVPDPIIQEAMNYACSSGADCASIQPNGLCFEPNTPFAHASYAFNSYWQRTKVAGGSCSFGGIAMLVTVDPSYDGCHFVYS